MGKGRQNYIAMTRDFQVLPSRATSKMETACVLANKFRALISLVHQYTSADLLVLTLLSSVFNLKALWQQFASHSCKVLPLPCTAMLYTTSSSYANKQDQTRDEAPYFSAALLKTSNHPEEIWQQPETWKLKQRGYLATHLKIQGPSTLKKKCITVAS